MYEGTYLCNIRSLFYLMYSARGNRRPSPCDNFFPKARRKRKREGRMRSSACALTSYRVLWAYALDSRQAKSTASSMDAIRFAVADEFTISSAKLRRSTLTSGQGDVGKFVGTVRRLRVRGKDIHVPKRRIASGNVNVRTCECHL